MFNIIYLTLSNFAFLYKIYCSNFNLKVEELLNLIIMLMMNILVIKIFISLLSKLKVATFYQTNAYINIIKFKSIELATCII